MKQPVKWNVIRVLTVAHVLWPGFIIEGVNPAWNSLEKLISEIQRLISWGNGRGSSKWWLALGFPKHQQYHPTFPSVSWSVGTVEIRYGRKRLSWGFPIFL